MKVQSSSPKKKKHKHRHSSSEAWTAERVFLEDKMADYQVSHPDMGEEEVAAKLRKKFLRLSDKKLVCPRQLHCTKPVFSFIVLCKILYPHLRLLTRGIYE